MGKQWLKNISSRLRGWGNRPKTRFAELSLKRKKEIVYLNLPKRLFTVSAFATFRNLIYYKTFRGTTNFIPKNYFSNFSLIPRWNFDVLENFPDVILATTFCHASQAKFWFCFEILIEYFVFFFLLFFSSITELRLFPFHYHV